jgi:4-carboxymuconolactone decarboxylase
MQKSPLDPEVFLPEEIRAVSPALERYMQSRLQGDLWKRPDLSLLDRSIVTLSAPIARNQTVEMVKATAFPANERTAPF